jgi:hypothetical protein
MSNPINSGVQWQRRCRNSVDKMEVRPAAWRGPTQAGRTASVTPKDSAADRSGPCKRGALSVSFSLRMRRFQLHLSSIVVLTLITGALLGVNILPQFFACEETFMLQVYSRGWPLLYELDIQQREKVKGGVLENIMKRTGKRDNASVMAEVEKVNATMRKITDERDQLNTYRSSRIAADIACALLIITVAAALAEWLARRKNGREKT